MKNTIIILLFTLLLAICPFAFAQEDLPPELMALYEDDNETTAYSDAISFEMPDGTQLWYIINEWASWRATAFRRVNGTELLRVRQRHQACMSLTLFAMIQPQ